MNYVLSRKAEEDIVEIFLFGVTHFGLEEAERYHDRLARCFDFLAENPFVARERTEISPPVRIHPIGSHLIIYRIDDEDKVFIIRVRHAHEDWQGEADHPPLIVTS